MTIHKEFFMRMKHAAYIILTMVIFASILPSCTFASATLAPAALPTVDQQPTFNFIKTQAAETIAANLTVSAPSITPIIPTNTSVPSDTPEPTNPPEPTNAPEPTNTQVPPTAYPTATYIIWTQAPLKTSTPVGFGCTIQEVSPSSTVSFKPGVDFDGRWVVKNTGAESWTNSDVDIKYISGTKFQTDGNLFDLKSTVAKNGTYTFIVDMKAPGDAGTYRTSWAFVRGGQTICSLNLTIVVVK
jgi:cytoskeletal protein RodZ